MKNIIVALFAVGVLIAAFAVGSSLAQKPIALMVDIPSDMEQNNPVPMILHWDKGDKSYYYFNWGLQPSAGYRLEYSGFIKNAMTVKAIVPGYQQMVAQVLTYPKLLMELPKGSYNYHVVDENGKDITSTFQTKQTPLTLEVTLPIDGKLTVRRIWREQAGSGDNKAGIALDALFAQPEMDLYSQVKVAGVNLHQDRCEVKMGASFAKLDKLEKDQLTRSIRETVMGLKLKGIKNVEILAQ